MTAKDFLKERLVNSENIDLLEIENIMIKFAEKHVNNALTVASNNAYTEEHDYVAGLGGRKYETIVCKDSILKSYKNKIK